MKKKDALLEQVNLRLDILEGWVKQKQVPWKMAADGTLIRDSRGELTPDFAPLNLLQFCNWVADQNGVASGEALARLRRISRMSLYQPYHNDLREKVETMFKVVKACLALQVERSNKISIIEDQESKIRLLQNIVDAQARESRLARHQVIELTRKYRMRHEEQRRVISQLKADVVTHEEKISTLTATLSKVASLRVAKSAGKPRA